MGKDGSRLGSLRVVADDHIPYLRGQAERLGPTRYLPGAAIKRADVADADVLIIRTRTRCTRELLDGTAVRFVATATIGFDHIDTDYLAQAGIAWANCPGCNATSVAQYVATSLLRLAEAGHVRLPGCCVGVVGVGHVGTAVCRALRTLGVRLLLCDPPRAAAEGAGGFVSIDEVYARADVITFHVPLTADGPWATRHMADFARMERRPVVINAARGAVVDNAALLAALTEGRVRAAVVDTWEHEPDILRPLLGRVFIGTPHIAGYSADGKAAGTRMALEAVARHFGLPLHFDIQPPALPTDLIPADDPSERMLQLYDPLVDSRALKACPEKFEYLREHYPLRREHF